MSEDQGIQTAPAGNPNPEEFKPIFRAPLVAPLAARHHVTDEDEVEIEGKKWATKDAKAKEPRPRGRSGKK